MAQIPIERRYTVVDNFREGVARSYREVAGNRLRSVIHKAHGNAITSARNETPLGPLAGDIRESNPVPWAIKFGDFKKSTLYTWLKGGSLDYDTFAVTIYVLTHSPWSLFSQEQSFMRCEAEPWLPAQDLRAVPYVDNCELLRATQWGLVYATSYVRKACDKYEIPRHLQKDPTGIDLLNVDAFDERILTFEGVNCLRRLLCSNERSVLDRRNATDLERRQFLLRFLNEHPHKSINSVAHLMTMWEKWLPHFQIVSTCLRNYPNLAVREES